MISHLKICDGKRLWLGALLLLLLAATVTFGQRWRFRGERNSNYDSDPPAVWEVEDEFRKDVFTFNRIKYDTWGYSGWGGQHWTIDHPDAEWNFVFRLQQVTSIKTHPKGQILELTDKELFNQPFIYIVEPGSLLFKDDEVTALRKYLLNGGFLMVDDFWGERQWHNLYEQLKRVLPDREVEDVQLDHPIFSCVFPLKEKPQVPNVGTGTASQYNGVTWETYDSQEPHYRAFFDDKRRIMVMICHNTDLGDGWEREGENEYYFREFSEKKAYPLGINILFYAMTH
jgi:hypothetical protein